MRAMRSLWKSQVPGWICLFLLLSMDGIPGLGKVNLGTQGASIDKLIVESAPQVEMFDFFHVMPKGKVEVMTEWDLLLTMAQYQALYQNNGRVKRKSLADVNKKWKNCYVYYEVHESLDTPSVRDVIQEAIKEWNTYTCLSFIESSTNDQRILFKDGGGCYSNLGMQDDGPQPVVLASGCRTKGIVAHEIGHAIGWVHEHMRPDRDNYIYVNLAAIDKLEHGNYRKYEQSAINTYGIPYDYTSLMHYGNSVFPGLILALDPKYQDKLGQRKGLSFKDIKLANIMYDCAPMHCAVTQCPDDGFQMPKSYKGKGKCECWCDSGNITDPLVLCSERETPPPPPQLSSIPTTLSDKTCQDVRNDCKYRKGRGHCMTKMALMMRFCSKTCKFCDKGEGVCMDYDKGCPIMAASGACTKPGLQKKMEGLCRASCDLCPKLADPCSIQKAMLGEDATLSDIIPGSGVAVSALLFSYLLPVLTLYNACFQ